MRDILACLDGGEWICSEWGHGEELGVLLRPSRFPSDEPWGFGLLATSWVLTSDRLLTHGGDLRAEKDLALAPLEGETVLTVRPRFEDYAFCITTTQHRLIVITNKLRWTPENELQLWDLTTPGHPDTELVVAHADGQVEFVSRGAMGTDGGG